jgi:hypothetical protein
MSFWNNFVAKDFLPQCLKERKEQTDKADKG